MSKSFRRKIDAERWAVDQEAAKHSGDWIDPALRRLPFSHFAEVWLSTVVDLKPKTLLSYRSHLNRYVLPRFGDTPVGQIDRPVVRAFVAELVDRGLGAGTVRNALAVVRPVLGCAAEAGALRMNPAAGVRPPKAERSEMRFLTAEQVERLADAIAPPYGVMVRTAAYSGLRAGELAALRVRDFDSMRARLHVRQSVADVRGEMVFGPTKNHQQRAAPLPRTIADQLAEFLTDRASDPKALVFTSPDGSVLRQTNFLRRQYKPAVVEAGLDPALRFHDLRHTAAALMVEMGAHPRAMMERLGHSSVTVTLDTYGHLLPSLEESLTEALDDRLRSAMAASANKPRPVRAPSAVIPLRKENRSAL